MSGALLTNQSGLAGRLRGRVMLVADRHPARRSLASWLRKAGCRVLEADDAENAANLMSECVDVVVIDMRRRGEEGLDLLTRIKRRFPGTEVIMMVGRDQLNLSIRGMKAGAFDDMATPLDVALFLKKIAQAIDRRRTLRVGRDSEKISVQLNEFLSKVGLVGQPVYWGLACGA